MPVKIIKKIRKQTQKTPEDIKVANEAANKSPEPHDLALEARARPQSVQYSDTHINDAVQTHRKPKISLDTNQRSYSEQSAGIENENQEELNRFSKKKKEKTLVKISAKLTI